MITLRVQAPYASFRKSYARSFAETYPFPPPATVYGMLLSLVGERSRNRHDGVALAFAFARQPQVTTTLRKLSRYKYGVANKQSTLGNAPDFIETLCSIDFLCWVDSSRESQNLGNGSSTMAPTLESRIVKAVKTPGEVNRTGVLCLGLSDDAVDDISLLDSCEGMWHWLTPKDDGDIELPVWVDHVGSFYTRWQRYCFGTEASVVTDKPSDNNFTKISDPRS